MLQPKTTPDVSSSSPASSAERSEIELSGFSGARVLLIREHSGQPFVRKISASAAGNARLQAQAIRQKLIAGLIEGSARTPKVFSEGFEGDLYYFDMEYVHGLDGISFLRTASFPAILRFTEALCTTIERFARLVDRELQISPREAALGKCHEIRAAMPADQPRAVAAMGRLIDLVETSAMPDSVAVTACHGDMTLENIVVTDSGEIVFIDLLDTFFNHWTADIGKLDQDLKVGWYTRKSPPLPVGVVAFVRKSLGELAERLFPGSRRFIALFVCIHLARILPYAKTAQDRDFVLDRLEYQLDLIQPVLQPDRRFA
jgi:hypothetical protein